jgi:hypothetical protein
MKKNGHSMKYLIVSGDSNTDPYFGSITHPDWRGFQHHPDIDFSYKKWPELLAEKLGMKCINMAKCGQGNEYIYSTIRDEIAKIEDNSQIGLVIATWSQATRKDYKQLLNAYSGEDKLGKPKLGSANAWRDVTVNTHGNLPGWVQKSLGHYLDFQILCERYNLPYVQFQMIELYEHYINGLWPSQSDIHFGADPNVHSKYPGNKTKDEASILKSILEYEAKLDTSKFMGWPPVQQLGGWRFRDQLDFFDNSKSKLRVSELDNHPNGLGHIAMCDKINILLKEYKILKE